MIKKIISGVVCLCFIATNSLWAIPSDGIEFHLQGEMPAFLQIEIPPELANIDEIYQAPAKADPRLLLHIQNAHGNYEAQVKIKKLLDYLNVTYGFKLLFLEGAVEKLNADYLRLFSDEKQNLELADYLAKQGQLTGAEYYLMSAPKDVEAIGIEQSGLYRENYEAFKKVYGAKGDIDEFLQRFESKLEMLSSRFFPAETRTLLSEWKKFEIGHREFLPYAKRLAEEAKKILGIDLESLFAQVEWPQLTRLLVLQSMESELDRPKALKEKSLLVDFLKTHAISERVIQGVEKLEEKHIAMNRLQHGGEDKENMPRYLLENLVAEAGPKGFYFHDYPAFSLYAGYLILQSELESKPLFAEMERLFEKILNELAVSELERNLLELFRDGSLFRKLLHLELTRSEWERAAYRQDWIHPETLIKRVKALIEKSGDKDDWRIENSEALTNGFDAAFHFYDLARQRESIFYSTIKQEMEKRKFEKAVLITGGFHTEGLMEMLRKDEINYGILTPHLTETPDNSNYVSSMLENRPTMFDIQTIETINLMQDVIIRSNQGAESLETAQSKVVQLTQEIKFLLEAYIKTGKFSDLETARKAFNFFNVSLYGKNRGVELVYDESKKALNIKVNGRYVTMRNPKGQSYLIDIPISLDAVKKGVRTSDHMERGELVPLTGIKVPSEKNLNALIPARSEVRAFNKRKSIEEFKRELKPALKKLRKWFQPTSYQLNLEEITQQLVQLDKVSDSSEATQIMNKVNGMLSQFLHSRRRLDKKLMSRIWLVREVLERYEEKKKWVVELSPKMFNERWGSMSHLDLQVMETLTPQDAEWIDQKILPAMKKILEKGGEVEEAVEKISALLKERGLESKINRLYEDSIAAQSNWQEEDFTLRDVNEGKVSGTVYEEILKTLIVRLSAISHRILYSQQKSTTRIREQIKSRFLTQPDLKDLWQFDRGILIGALTALSVVFLGIPFYSIYFAIANETLYPLIAPAIFWGIPFYSWLLIKITDSYHSISQPVDSNHLDELLAFRLNTFEPLILWINRFILSRDLDGNVQREMDQIFSPLQSIGQGAKRSFDKKIQSYVKTLMAFDWLDQQVNSNRLGRLVAGHEKWFSQIQNNVIGDNGDLMIKGYLRDQWSSGKLKIDESWNPLPPWDDSFISKRDRISEVNQFLKKHFFQTRSETRDYLTEEQEVRSNFNHPLKEKYEEMIRPEVDHPRSELREAKPAIVSRPGRPVRAGERQIEDRYFIARIETETGLKGQLLGVVDGFGGHWVSEVVSKVFPQLFEAVAEQTPAENGQVNIRKVFKETIDFIQKEVQKQKSGSTLSVVFVPENESVAYVAVIGDSPVFIFDQKKILFKSPEHNVGVNPREVARAKKRLKQPDLQIEDGYLRNPENGAGLQLTRALGDIDMGNLLDRRPQTFKVSLDKNQGPIHLVVATDGVLDPSHQLTAQKVKIIADLVRQGKGPEDFVPKEPVDDATAIVWELPKRLEGIQQNNEKNTKRNRSEVRQLPQIFAASESQNKSNIKLGFNLRGLEQLSKNPGVGINPALIVQLVAGKILGPEAKAAGEVTQILEKVTELEKGPVRLTLQELKSQMEKMPQPASDLPGSLVILKKGLPRKTELDGIASQLAANKNQRIFIAVSTANLQTGKEGLIFRRLKNQILHRFGIDIGKPGDRFELKVIEENPQAVTNILRVISAKLYRSMESIAKTLNVEAPQRSNHFVVLAENNTVSFIQNADVLPATIIESNDADWPVQNAPALMVAQKFVAGWFSQHLTDAAELSKETMDALDGKDGRYRVNVNGLLGIAAKLWTVVQATRRVATAA